AARCDPQHAVERNAACLDGQVCRIRREAGRLDPHIHSARREIRKGRLARCRRYLLDRPRAHGRPRNIGAGRVAYNDTKVASVGDPHGGERENRLPHFRIFSAFSAGLIFAFFSSTSSTSLPSEDSVMIFGNCIPPYFAYSDRRSSNSTSFSFGGSGSP